ncbi:MAG: cation transporter [Bacteroidales bacterium]|nr:cation transporter [Bacteroidales bacterium]
MHEHNHHHHHHHAEVPASMGLVYILSIVLNVLFVAVEAGVGFWSGSLGLLSDAGHNLGDVFSLLLALVAFRLALTHGNSRFTYGYRKASVLISLLNAIILLVAVGAIVIESIHKFSDLPGTVLNARAISWTAGIGILVNGFTTWLLSRGQSHDINARGAFLHMLADTLVSVGVVLSGILIQYTGWVVVDPIVSLVIAVIILVTAWKLLAESFRMSIDAVPSEIDPDEIRDLMAAEPGVLELHHLHIWPISTTQVALTAHLVVEDLSQMQDIVHSLKHKLAEEGIAHCTLETETPGAPCPDHDCS